MDTPRETYEVPILWDIMDEYVDESEFALERLESALEDPEYNLTEVAQGMEEKLLACVDGLVIAGPRVVDRLLVPALEQAEDLEDDLHRATAIVLTLLMMRRREWVAGCLADSRELQRRAAVWACALDPDLSLDDWLRAQLSGAGTDPQRAGILEAMAQRRIGVPDLSLFLRSDNVAVLRAALRVARYVDPRPHMARLEALALAESALTPELRHEARWTALYCGIRRVWPLVQRQAFDAQHGAQAAMALLAGLGEPRDLQAIAQALQEPDLQERALRSLGASGRVSEVPRLLSHMSAEPCDPRQAKLAVEALATITGLELYEDRFVQEVPRPEEPEALVALEDDVEAEDFVLDPVEDLPLPNVAALTQWWSEQTQMHGHARLIGGKPWGPAALSAFLEQGSLRSRHFLATELAVRTRGLVDVPTRALSQVQRRWMAQVAQLDARLFEQRPF